MGILRAEDVMKKVPPEIWKANDRRLKLFRKRMKQELPKVEEMEYQRLTRKINDFIRKTWPEDADTIRDLQRSPYTGGGEMIRIVRRRNRAKRKGRPPATAP